MTPKPPDGRRVKMTVDQRFWSKIEKTGGCWLWISTTQGPAARVAYGVFFVRGRGTLLAHRYSYERVHGPIPPGLVIDHLCRTPLCVRPDHLEAVTNWTNVVERGGGPVNRNLNATHCIHGHPFDEKNTYVSSVGDRSCRRCGADRRRRYVAARKAANREGANPG